MRIRTYVAVALVALAFVVMPIAAQQRCDVGDARCASLFSHFEDHEGVAPADTSEAVHVGWVRHAD